MQATRILVVLHELTHTGAPRLTLDTLDAVRQQASVRIVSVEGGSLVNEARRLGPTVVLRQADFTRILPRRLATGRVVELLASVASRIRGAREAAVLRRWKPQLAYVSSATALSHVPRLRLTDIPIVLQVHELGSALEWFERANPGLILSIPDRYVAVSDAVARDLVNLLGVPSGAVSVIAPYVLGPVPDATGRDKDADHVPLVVGGAGNPHWTKGMDLWLLTAREAVDRLGAERLRFVWVGYRDNQAGLQFRTMISKLGLDDVVELVQETDRPFDHFARFDIFAMSSWEDAFGLAVLETMAMGIPVVCFSRTGGPAEVVDGAGVVISEMSPSRMADAIVDLANSPQKRREVGSACAARVRERYQRSTYLAALTEVFDAAVNSRPTCLPAHAEAE
jgi:glycosyltransferase involved in cell wall biosynthesis